MDEKALDALRNGLEDSYWYGDDDEKVFDELVRKAKAWDKLEFILEGEIVEAYPVYSNDGTKKADAPINVKIGAWESILMSMQDLVGSIKSEEDDQ